MTEPVPTEAAGDLREIPRNSMATGSADVSGVAIVIDGVSVVVDGASILSDISVEIHDGAFVSVVGPSGCGKTTLLRLCAGLALPTKGTVRFGGASVVGPGLDRGIVFQDYSLFPWMTLLDNVAFAVAKARPDLSGRERTALSEKYLELVGLTDAMRRYPHQLSGGMLQRGAISRCLAMGARFLLMDEPFGALDLVNRTKLQDLLGQIRQSLDTRQTVLFVTHDIEEALYLSDRILVLGSRPGRLIADIDVCLPRPRSRRDLGESRVFRELRASIHDTIRNDLLRQLDASAPLGGDT